MNRRTFIKSTLQLGLTLSIASPTVLRAARMQSPSLSFYHTHTGEKLDFCIIEGECSNQDQYNLFRFLRDFRTGETHPMDLSLFHTLQKIQEISGSTGVYQVISGYRSPATNALLRSKTSGVAKKSYHMKGQAIDVRLTDLPTRHLRDAAIELKAGGVGFYPKSNFVHIDTGPIRSW